MKFPATIGIFGTPIYSTTEEIIKVSDFALGKLMPECRKKISIDIELLSNISCKSWGTAVAVDDHKENPVQFRIELIRSMSKAKITKYLIHELVHVKQFHLGELVYSDPVVWHGQKWLGPLDESDPLNLPWEVECWGKADILYDEWIVNGGSIMK